VLVFPQACFEVESCVEEAYHRILSSRGHQVPKGVEPTVMMMMMIDDDDVHDHDHNDLDDDNNDDVDDNGGDD